jgi:hypothetical protein
MVERELLTPEILRERLAGAELREQFRRGLGRYTGQLPGLFTETARKLYPRVIEVFAGLLREPEIHNALVEQGREIVDDIIFNLPSIQRFLITSGQFDRSIKENMDTIVDDIAGRLKSTGCRDDIRDAVISGAGNAIFAGDSPSNLDALVTEKLFAALDSQIEGILGAVNVRAMVQDRINSMDMIRVEGIILDVMANQLKWIDVFGAILGFLIGVFQALFSWMMRNGI